jgi:hypothetical protein
VGRKSRDKEKGVCQKEIATHQSFVYGVYVPI